MNYTDEKHGAIKITHGAFAYYHKCNASHCFHLQFLTTTFLFTIVLVAHEGSISENRQRQW